MTGHGLPKKVPPPPPSKALASRWSSPAPAPAMNSFVNRADGLVTSDARIPLGSRARPSNKSSAYSIRTTTEAQQIVATIESERAGAVAAGNDGDWWEGESRKGVDHAQQKQFKDARDLQQAAEDGHEERLGLVSQEHETEDAALGAMTFEDMGLGSKTFDDIGYVSCDDELADEEVAGDGEEMAVDGGEATVQGEDMEGLEQADTTNMDVEMN
ncbi:MAG: hypothetical protein L6R36_003003 [Xanthoria steineri]|nr:MAG: hypothetical protein L6R36_003003 [Xanthoria steineri]